MNVRYSSNPAGFGAEWSTDSSEWQLSASRYSDTVIMGVRSLVKLEQPARWAYLTMSEPQRFGALPVQSLKAFQAYVTAFLEAGSSSSDAESEVQS